MTYFPVTNSNLSATHLGWFLQEKYAFSKDTQCQLIRAGINDTYLVTDNLEKFIFRIYSLDWRTKTEINEEIRLLNLLKDRDISISFPIEDKMGQYIQELNAPEGQRFAVLFSYADGQKRHNVSAETHFKIGELMARLHAVTNNLTLERVTYSPEIMLKNPFKHLSKFLSEDTEEMAFMLLAQKYLLKTFDNAETAQIRQGIVHLDIWFDNLNVTNADKVTIFDFDFCGNGWLGLDIAYYIM
jgi:Ser/Thr protein kinase RdoA (MazF antagonist)